MTKKSLNLAKELGKYSKMFNDRYMFADERFLGREEAIFVAAAKQDTSHHP
jgi:hypothetical protein